MNSETQVSAPKWFTAVAVIALLWNLMGVAAFIAQVSMTPEMIGQLPAAEQELYRTLPMWALIAFGCAVFGGALGSLGLLVKNRLALPLLAISLIGVVVQLIHSLFLSKSVEVYGPGGMIMPIMVMVIAIGLLLLAFKARSAGWFKA